MPLTHSGSREAIKSNIHEMVQSGYPVKRAVAAALRTADQYGKRRAAGGSLGANAGAPGTAYAPNIGSTTSNTPPSNFSLVRGQNGYTPQQIQEIAQTTSPQWGAPQQGTPFTGSTSGAVNSPSTNPSPTVPTYGTGSFMATPPATPNSPSGLGQTPQYSPGILPSGLMNVPQIGNYTLDPNTGALSPKTLQALSSFAMRGLPPSSTAPGYNSTGTGPAPASSATTDPAASANAWTDPNLTDTEGGGGGGFKRGGSLRRAAGGLTPPIAGMASSMARSGFRSIDHPAGLIRGMSGGRTDTVPMNVAAGSHVIPADVLSGLGDGSSLSGAHAMDIAMKTGPGGLKLPSGPHKTMALPHVPAGFADGGDPTFEGHALRLARGGVPTEKGGVRCMLASDEYLIPPDEVERIEHNGKKDHAAVDDWIMERRAKTIKTMRKLRPPVGMKK